MISNTELADVLIERLNDLIQDPKIREDISRLIDERIVVGEQTAAHATIQVQANAAGDNTLGFLGLLNGLVGIMQEGKLRGWGYIMAVFDDDKRLVRFRRSDAEKTRVEEG
jgi:hypothetical protein